jgi:hypothetical protein
VFSNLFSITLSNIGKYFLGIHFPRNSLFKKKYFPANKRGLNRTKTMSRWHGLPVQIRSKFVRDFSGMCFFFNWKYWYDFNSYSQKKMKMKNWKWKKAHSICPLVWECMLLLLFIKKYIKIIYFLKLFLISRWSENTKNIKLKQKKNKKI